MNTPRPSEFESRLIDFEVPSTLDGTAQPCRLLPAEADQARPLLVVLHTWMGDVRQNLDGYLRQADARGWHALIPHFRGPNVQPEACGSTVAVQDVFDAIDAALKRCRVDPTRLYLVGGSGGGHMTMRVAAHQPERFTAASAWCGIADLAAWHAETQRDPRFAHYARSIEQCVGGEPSGSPAIDEQIHLRSPLHHITRAADLPIEFSAGIRDGKDGSVPFWHSIWAFNRLAAAHGNEPVSEAEIRELWDAGRLRQPRENDERLDPHYEGRPIYLRRHSRLSRLTLFEGGHDSIPSAACHWLSRFVRVEGAVVEAAPADAPLETSDEGTLGIEG